MINLSSYIYMVAYIYKLVDKRTGKLFYIGSTTGSLNVRLNGHIADVNRNQEGLKLRNKIKKIGIKNIKIVQLQRLNTNDKTKIKKREKYWINKLKGFDKDNTINPI